ncbi:DNA sulfur modification protein DndB [Alkalihalobacillus sp. NPDC078783]
MFVEAKGKLLERIKDELGNYNKGTKLVELQKAVSNYKVSTGRVISILNNPNQLDEMDEAELYVFTNALYSLNSVDALNPSNYFTNNEIKDYGSTFEGYVSDKITFPHTFDNAHQVNDEYIIFVDIATLRRLDNGGEVRYNEKTQRSGKEVNGVFEADINMNHVNQMRELLKKQELESSLLVFNARRDTADDMNVGEVVYNKELNKLTITKGTLFDCIDGYHRFLALTGEQANNPSIEMQVPIKIKNTSEKGARRAFTQINTYHPILTSHKRRMDENDLGAEVIRRFIEDSQLGSKVAKNSQINSANTLTTFATLASAADKSFDLNDRSDTKYAADYLVEALDEVTYTFPELMDNALPSNRQSLLYKTAFWGALVNLTGKAKEMKLNYKAVAKTIKDIDFSYDNSLWIELEVIKEDKTISSNAETKLTKYFFSIIENN